LPAGPTLVNKAAVTLQKVTTQNKVTQKSWCIVFKYKIIGFVIFVLYLKFVRVIYGTYGININEIREQSGAIITSRGLPDTSERVLTITVAELGFFLG
jgi:hypothetical protein